jgi:GNAT superfamily N-acetyltransferase
MEDGVWYLNRAIIRDPKARGRGVGTTLLTRLLQEVAAQGCTRLIVEPGGYGADPQKQRRFYEKSGFRAFNTNGALVWEPTWSCH